MYAGKEMSTDKRDERRRREKEEDRQNYFDVQKRKLEIEEVKAKTNAREIKLKEKELELIATYADGHTDNVASLATYSDYDKNVIQVVNSRISAINDGSTQLTATYKGARGNEHSQTIIINATTFPLTAGAFNPSIWEHGTFDAQTSTVSTGRYGFAGWKYDNGLDISKHKYLIVEIEGGEGAQVSFRLFDQNNYWSDCATFDFGNSNNLVIPIGQIRRSKNPERAFATNHIYIIGFWSTGGKEFRI
jgi:hypothetical protein